MTATPPTSKHPLAQFSLQELEQATETAFFLTAPDVFLSGGLARYALIEEALTTFTQPSMARKVGSAILTAQARSLRTVQLMAGRGYPQEAATLARTALERAYHQAFIGADEAQAVRWHAHSSDKTFEPFINCVRAVGKRWFDKDMTTRQQFEDTEATLYAEVSAYSHHNPKASKLLDLRTVDGEVTLTPLPMFTPQGFIGCATTFLATQRAVEISLHAFVEAFSRDQAERDGWQARIEALGAERQTQYAQLQSLQDDPYRMAELERRLSRKREEVLSKYVQERGTDSDRQSGS